MYKALRFFQYLNAKFKLKYKKNVNLILIGSPNHGNIGDHAISIAESCLLQDNHISFVEISISDYYRLKTLLLKKEKNSKSNIIFAITGGGFLGDIWELEKKLIEDVVGSFNDVFIFPQTLSSINNDWTNNFKILSEQKNIVITFRDRKSFEIFNTSKSYLIPDMVLYLTKIKKRKIKGNRIGVCFRNDKEKLFDSFDNVLKSLIGCEIDFFDTVINKKISFFNRKRIFKKMLNKVAKYKMVITDRLHCMIFCYLTNTPCIAFDNTTKKISGVYEWLNCNYIRVLNELNEFTDTYNYLTNLKELEDNTNLKSYYKNLVSLIKGDIDD